MNLPRPAPHRRSGAVLLRRAACGLALCGLAACDSESTPEPARGGPNVLLVSVDTLRADRLGCYGGDPSLTPHFDALAARGLRFTRAFAPVPLTLPSHSSMLSGLHPPSHGVRDNALYRLPDPVTTLAEVASEAGFDTAAFIAAFVLDARFGLAQGFEHYDDDIERPTEAHDGTVHERPAAEVTDRALAWLATPRDRPFVAWVHYYDPHFPYEPPAAVAARFPGRAYDAEVAEVDAQFGRLLDSLDRQGTLDDTLVVLTADHGESLGDHDEPTHGHFVYQSTMALPLILAHPRLASGGTRDEAAGLVDVMPTVLAFLGLDTPPCDGRDLLADAPADAVPLTAVPLTAVPLTAVPLTYMESELARISFGFRPLAAASDGRWKYVDAPEPELYDLLDDPGEGRNLLAEEGGGPAEVVARLRAHIERCRGVETPDARFTGTDSVRDAVESLGYVVGQATTEVGREHWTRAELLQVVGLRDLARGQMTAGRWAECVQSCTELLELAPDCAQAWEVGGTALARMQRWEEAKRWLREALARHEALPESHWNLGVALQRTGEVEQAWLEVERTHQLDPDHQGALALLAQRCEGRGETETAIELYRRLARVAAGTPAGLDANRQLQRLGAAAEGASDE